MGHWNKEVMVINYKTENPAADRRREHAATVYAQLEELQQTFKGSFFLAVFESEELQRPTFAEISPFSKFYDVRVWCLVFPPYMQPGGNADFYCNHHQFSVPNNCCYRHSCNCSALHTQLVEYSKILLVAFNACQQGIWSQQFQTIYHLPHSISKCLN